MLQKTRSAKVAHLEREGVLFVEDGNHGEYRPLRHEFTQSGVPFVRPPDLVGGRVLFDKCDRIDAVARRRVRKGIGQGGDILLTHRATVGRMALVPFDAPEFVTNPGVTVWRCLDENQLDRRYLYYWMQTPAFMDQVWAVANSSDTFPYIGLLQQRELTIHWPDIGMQRAIGKTLGALDDKIELNRRMNATLEGMAQAIFRDWFVDFGPTRRKLAAAGAAAGRKPATDPVEIMGGLITDPARASTLAALFPDALGDDGLPVGWTTTPLLSLAEWVNGAAYKNMHFSEAPDALPVIKIAELKSGVTATTKRTNTQLGERYRIKDGELLFSWSGNPDTSIDTFVWVGGEAWLNQHIFAVRENGRRSAAHLHTLLRYLRPEFAELARNKQTTGLGHVTKENMGRLMVVDPPAPVCQEFDKIIGPIHGRFRSTLVENQTLAATRDLLLPKLMSGEIRLPQAEAIVEAAS